MSLGFGKSSKFMPDFSPFFFGSPDDEAEADASSPCSVFADSVSLCKTEAKAFHRHLDSIGLALSFGKSQDLAA